jgi:hypothetical protein
MHVRVDATCERAHIERNLSAAEYVLFRSSARRDPFGPSRRPCIRVDRPDEAPLWPPKRAVFVIRCRRAAHATCREDAMTRARVLIAGLTVISAMIVADAFAQDCPEWLKWACPDNPASNAPAMTGGQQSRRGQISRTKSARRAGASSATNPTPKQTQAPETQGRAKPTSRGDVDRSGDQRLASREARRSARPRPAMNEQEKEALFQQFLLWRKEQRPGADTSR